MLKLWDYTPWSLAVILLLASGIRSHSNTSTLSIRMPGASPLKDNAYLCTSVKLASNDQYIVQFEPKGDKNVAHHMLLFGCDKPASWSSNWDCGNGGTCQNIENIIFAWANGASDKALPKDVGFQVGRSSGINYLVLQVHYKHKAIDLNDNDSGFVLHITPQRQPYLAGIFLMWSGDVDIPPETNGIHSDIVCKYQERTTMYAFAFRTHAHGLGRVISGYKVNKNNWTLLGKGDPNEPQAFYPMKGIYKISKGDTLAARCTYDSKGHHLKDHVYIGATGDDEMCNFYIMYYRDANEPDVTDAACDDQLSYQASLNFPADSDTALRKPTRKITSNTHRITTGTQPMKVPTNKMTATVQKTSTYDTKPSIMTPRQNPVIHPHKVYKKPSPPSMHHKVSSLKDEYNIVKGWPKLDKEHLGQVAGVAVNSKGRVIVFHRGKRIWDYNSFDDLDVFTEKTPIDDNTVLTLDAQTGKILGRWGRNMFYLPHGITVDHHDNIWLTDVATHQVYKFPSNGGSKALLTVGEKFYPDSDDSHFCKPADVAVERSGSFYVADGYCNNRIVKFSSKGKYIDEWGKYGRKKGEFILPHSLSLDESKHHLYIADRQNGRVQILSTTRGVFLPVIKKQQFGYVFAVDFNSHTGHLHVINGNPSNTKKPKKGFTLHGNHLVETWPTDDHHFLNPHDVTSSADDDDLYVVEIGPNKIWKLTKHKSNKHKDDTLNFPAICTLEKDTGPCRAAMPRYYFSVKKKSCEHFVYGGCRGNENNFKSKRECEAKCGHSDLSKNITANTKTDDEERPSEENDLRGLDSGKESANNSATVHVSTAKPKETDDWQNAFGEDEGNESNIYAAAHYNKSSNHTMPHKAKKNQSKDSEEEVMGGMIPALVILSVLAVPIVFLLLISIALRIRAYRRDSRYKSNRLLKSDQDGLAVGRTRGWLSYLNCCSKQNYRFDKVNLAEFYSDSESDGV